MKKLEEKEQKNNPDRLVKFEFAHGVQAEVESHILGGYIRISIRIF